MVGWAASMSFASIYHISKGINPWKFVKKSLFTNLRESHFTNLLIFNLRIQDSIFVLITTMKIRLKWWDGTDGTWLPAKNYICINICNTVHVSEKTNCAIALPHPLPPSSNWPKSHNFWGWCANENQFNLNILISGTRQKPVNITHLEGSN